MEIPEDGAAEEVSWADRVAAEFESLALDSSESSIARLATVLREKDPGTYDKHILPRLACRALLHHGERGVNEMVEALPDAPGAIYPKCIIEALWFAAKGELGLDIFDVAAHSRVLVQPPPPESVIASRLAVANLLAESRANDELFWRLLDFVTDTANLGRGRDDPSFMHDVRVAFAEASIKLSPSLIREFRAMVREDLPEESYQQFLKEHPVFLDPLADLVVPKQKLGLEFVTDFAIRRLDDRWVLVEIEKPQDKIVTAANDISAHFMHGYGQVLDFQRWVAEHGEYARSLMPAIASPPGLLVIGRRSELPPEGLAKLAHFISDSRSIDVLTYEDVLRNAEALYKNLYYRPLEE